MFKIQDVHVSIPGSGIFSSHSDFFYSPGASLKRWKAAQCKGFFFVLALLWLLDNLDLEYQKLRGTVCDTPVKSVQNKVQPQDFN